MPARPKADPDHFTEALAFLRARVPMTDPEFKALTDASHARAFTIAGVAELDIVNQVWTAIGDAIKRGESLGQFKSRVSEALTRAWGRENPWRMELVFRNGVQSSYGRGRWQQQHDPSVLKSRPYMEYNAILDARTTKTCRKANGTVLPAEHLWWKTHSPPLHHHCRGTTISLTAQQAKEQGIKEKGPDAPPGEGFGEAPGGKEWKPDLSKYPQQLSFVFKEKKLRVPKQPKPKPAPPPKPKPPKSQQELMAAMPAALRKAGLRAEVHVTDVKWDDPSRMYRGYRELVTGKLGFSRDVTAEVRSAIAAGAEGKPLAGSDLDGLRTVVHEHIHGLGPHRVPFPASKLRSGDAPGVENARAYQQPWGRLLEEGTTELLAVRSVRKVAEALVFQLPEEETIGPVRRVERDGRLTARHSYREEVRAVELLLQLASGDSEAVAGVPLNARGEALLHSLAYRADPLKRPVRLAQALAKAAGAEARPEKRRLFRDYIESKLSYLFTSGEFDDAAVKGDLTRIRNARTPDELREIRKGLGL
jgi:SPP1 gp7 family putative phage head morphogenesis protein